METIKSSGLDALNKIQKLVETQANKTPSSTAILCGTKSITYSELNKRAEIFSNSLCSQGKLHKEIVGILMPRSIEMIISIIGVLKSGRAFLLLDDRYPIERLKYMVEDCNISSIISHGDMPASYLSDFPDKIFLYDEIEKAKSSKNLTQRTGLKVSDLAYIIYTSGSTGRPKGVMIEHENAIALLDWAQNFFTAGQLSSVLISTSHSFDVFIFELFSPLVTGGCGILVDSILELGDLPSYLNPRLVSIAPSTAQALIHSISFPSSVTTVCSVGEYLRQETVDKYYEIGISEVFDLYGPSEDTTFSTVSLRVPNGVTDIGIPIDGTVALILDMHGKDVKENEIGELYLGGKGVARGYINKPELTSEKFITLEYKGTNNIFYRTGDLVLRNSIGRLEYKGRIDDQVKIRGQRVELGEIESCILENKFISDVSVVFESGGENGAYLVAFITTEELCFNTEILVSDLQVLVRSKLPDYMVPRDIYYIDSFPKTGSGKKDLLKLKSSLSVAII